MIQLSPDPRRPTPTLLTLTLLTAVVACADRTVDASSASTSEASSPAAAPASESASVRSLGTIEATLDGEARVWHVVEGQASDGPYASGVWIDTEDAVIVSLGGLDSADPPIETFSRGGVGGAGMSMGEYEGSSFTLQVQLSADAESATFDLPAEDGQATIAFAPVFDVEDMMRGMLLLVSGTVTVERMARSGGEVEISGTFEGTLEALEGDGSVTLTDGRFEVSGLPEASTIQPGGGGED